MQPAHLDPQPEQTPNEYRRQADIAAAVGQIQQAKGAYQQAVDELATKEELNRRNADIVARREIERLQLVVEQRQGALDAASAARQAAETRLSTLLPAEKASAEAALAQAQVELDKTVVYAGVDGRVEQFVLRVGDVVNPLMRPAGILIPSGAGRGRTSGRVRADRGSGDESGDGCRSDLRLQAIDDHSHRGNRRAGLYRYRPIPGCRAARRDFELAAAGNDPVFLEPLYKGGLEGRHAWQQLHRQCLFEQS